MAASTTLTPSQRSQRARLAALKRWAREDPMERSEKAREALLARFEDEPDPEAALKAHMAELSYRASRARGLRG